jgi:hypothetical protein
MDDASVSDHFDTMFVLEKYLRNVDGTRPESFDWSDPGPHLDDESLFCLRYLLDIEQHTIIYMRELLSTSVVEEPAITAFLSCWLYEEFCHSRTLAKLLETQGVRVDDRHFTELRLRRAGDYIAQFCATIGSRLTRHFPALHMTWGAINELTAVIAYQAMVDRARHPMVTTVLSRIVKDERRHFSFYYNQARIRLEPRAARRLTTFALRMFWAPIGSPVLGDAATRRLYDHLFRDEAGPRRLAMLDATIARLPGLEWFNFATRYSLKVAQAGRLDSEIVAAAAAR